MNIILTHIDHESIREIIMYIYLFVYMTKTKKVPQMKLS
jgi:hypothetical protein